MKNLKGFIILLIIGIIGMFSLSFIFNNDRDNLVESDHLIKELTKIRIAIDKYRLETGVLPNLCMEGANKDLSLLDYKLSDGRIISFKELLGESELPCTSKSIEIFSNNNVQDISDFSKADLSGGWVYDYSGQTGEIHINLASDIFNQGIDWIKY